MRAKELQLLGVYGVTFKICTITELSMGFFTNFFSILRYIFSARCDLCGGNIDGLFYVEPHPIEGGLIVCEHCAHRNSK